MQRQRAQSDATCSPTTLSSGRWRIVSAWTSSSSSATNKSPPNQQKRPFSQPQGAPLPPTPTPAKSQSLPRRRVSLFLKRRRSAQSSTPHLSMHCDRKSNDTTQNTMPNDGDKNKDIVQQPEFYDHGNDNEDDDDDDSFVIVQSLRRAKSTGVTTTSTSLFDIHEANKQFHQSRTKAELNETPSVSIDECNADTSRDLQSKEAYRENGNNSSTPSRIKLNSSSTSEHNTVPHNVTDGPAEVQYQSVQKIIKSIEERAEDESNTNNDNDSDIIGEICLENFAEDGETESDYDFLDGQSVDLSVQGPDGDCHNVKVDVRWEDKDFDFDIAALFASFIIDGSDAFTGSKDFDINEQMRRQWKQDCEEHNRKCLTVPVQSNHFPDIRLFAKHFS